MSDLGKIKRVQDVDITDKYLFWLPCAQADANNPAFDKSGQNNDFALAADLTGTEAWGTNPGWLTTGAAGVGEVANGHVVLDKAKFANLDITTHSFIWAFWIQGPFSFPGVISDGLMGCTAGGGDYGIRLFANYNATAENVTVRSSYVTASGVGVSANLGIGVINDGDPHHVIMSGDATTGLMDTYIDLGVNGSDSVDISGLGSAAPNNKDFMIGSDGQSARTVGLKTRDQHFLLFAGGLPDNISDIYNKLYTRRFFPLSSSEI